MNEWHQALKQDPSIQQHQIVKHIKSQLHSIYKVLYPNVYNFFEISSIIPMNTASCERTFSKINVIKTKLRNQMGIDTLGKNNIDKRFFISILIDHLLRISLLPQK
jgi:hypothetical protein